MKLFAPRNVAWDARTGSGFNSVGGSPPSGIMVTQDSAKSLSAVFSATRVISETLASLPCNLLEQVDERTNNRATEHPLWTLLHDQPNPEQDIMAWLDSQVAFQVNWGNCYAEKQYNSLGNIVALWPIHPSRIPLRNIVRNGTNGASYRNIMVGQPGEIVYHVNNDDGSASPIAASDMLHVPGVLSANGVTGQSIPLWGAASIGNALAAEAHAGAIFKNGGVSNFVLKHPGVLKQESIDKLRRQWQSTYGGVQNHYKPIIMEEGMEAVSVNMNPEVTQLLGTRQFSVTEIARWYRLPPHLLADLTRSTNSNIEAQGLEFVVYSMLPWIVRWEKAMQRQLLTPKEKLKYRFKFNVNGLLRGDQAARAQFYQTMFNLGAYSPNDIRAKEDENPISGGDQYFVQGNNAVPLDKVGELTQSQIDKSKQSNAPALPPPDTQPPKNHLADLRQQMVDMIAAHETAIPAQVIAAVNTQSETKAAAVLQSVRKALVLAIQGEVDQLMRYEARSAKEAAKKPQTFLAWRDEFYPKFTVKLATAIGVFAPAAEQIDVNIDCDAQAQAYVAESVTALDSLADLPCNDLESGIEQMVDAWAERPARLATAIFKGSTI